MSLVLATEVREEKPGSDVSDRLATPKQPKILSASYSSIDVRQLSYVRYAKLRVTELFKYRYALKSAVIVNLKRRYRRSSLGFAWSLLNPLLTMAVLALMFGTIFHQKYQTFSVYVFSALLPWNFIAQTMLQSTESFVNNESFLKRVVLPKTFFPLVTVCTEMVNFLRRSPAKPATV